MHEEQVILFEVVAERGRREGAAREAVHELVLDIVMPIGGGIAFEAVEECHGVRYDPRLKRRDRTWQIGSRPSKA